MNRSSSISYIQPTANVSLVTQETTMSSLDKGLVSYLLPGVLLGVLALYILAKVWALKRDRQNQTMVGATVIPRVRYHHSPHNYMLQFYTGSGRHDGTTANVYCCLHGNKRQTKPIVLRDSKRLLFQRGTLSSFLVTFNRSLDQIKRIHIWHDIAGPDPPWFLERVVVCHLNTGLTWHFEANRWLDVSQGDGTVECILEPETRKCLLGSKRLFDRQLPDNFKNKHMWFAPFLLKERTKFSRAQRVTCCGCLLGMSMLVVSVIIQITRNLDIFPSGVFRLGPITLAIKDIFKAAACAAVVFVFRLLLEFLMRRAQRKSDLRPDDKDVRGYLGYCKDKVGKTLFLDELSKQTDTISLNDKKTTDASYGTIYMSKAIKTEEYDAREPRQGETVPVDSETLKTNCQDEKHELTDNLQENHKVTQSKTMEQQGPKKDVHSTGNEEDLSVFTKKTYPSVKRMFGKQNNPSGTQSFGLLESLQDRRDSLTSSIDFQLFSQQHGTLTDDPNEKVEASVSSDFDQSNNSTMSNICAELLTLEDVQFVQPKHEEKENTTGRSFSPVSKSSKPEDKSTSYWPGNGLGAPQNRKKGNHKVNLEVQTGEHKCTNLSLTCSDLHQNKLSPRNFFWKSTRNTVVKDPEERKGAYIVEEKFYHELKPAVGSTQTKRRTVNNIDNAPKLWKALPFPREYLDKHSLKKLNEDNVYNLSHTWLVVTNVLSVIFPLSAAASTVSFGLSWSTDVIISWLVTVTLTIVIQSFIIETIFLFLHALYSAFWLKRPLDERNLLHELMNKVCIQEDYDGTYFVDDLDDLDRTLVPRPPTPEERREAREKAGRDRELEQVLGMIVFDVLFLLLLVIIGLGNRDLFSYPMRETMENTFNPSERFMKIYNGEKFWSWAKRDLIAGVYDVHNKNFLSDKYNSLLGTPILRQKRLQMGGTCPLPKEDIKNYFDECRARFVNEESEDTGRYQPGWQSDLAKAGSNHSSSSAWSYQSESESHTEYRFTGRVGTHGGGGYIAKLGFEQESAARLLDELQAHNWIDPYTRTVVFEVSTYNANVNILSVLSLSIEFTPSNGALPRIDIFTFRLYRYLTTFQLIFLVCEAIFVVFVVQLIYRTISIIALEGKAYFASVWNYSELLLILFSLITIGLYGARANNLGQAIKNIQKDSSVFYGFYSIAVSDNLVAYMSCLVFLIPVIQFLRFLKFNKDFMVFYSTLDRIRSDLGGFTVIMFISLFIFSYWAFAMLRTKEENYSTFMSVVGNMVSLIMGSFNFRIMSESRDLGPLFTYTFTFVNMFVLLNIVLCIIAIGFRESRHDERFQKSEYEVVAFIIYRVKGFLGLLPPYIPPPPKIVPPKVSYISEQWILNTSYITRNQLHRLDNFANKSYSEDFVDDLKTLLCASGISHRDEFALELLQNLASTHHLPGIKSTKENETRLKETSCTLDQRAEEIEQTQQIKIVINSAEDELNTTGEVVGQEIKPIAKNPATTSPKGYKFSLRRQLFEESLRNTRKKSSPDIMPERTPEFVSHRESMSAFHVKNVDKLDGTPAIAANTPHNRDKLMSRAISRRTSEGAVSDKSCPHPQDKVLQRYRLAIENELTSGVQQVFVKSACLPEPPGRKDQSLEKRRWSIETDLPVTLDSCAHNQSTRNPLSPSGASRLQTKTVNNQRGFMRSVSRRPQSPPSVVNTQQSATTKLQEGANRSRWTSQTEATIAPARPVVEPDTIHSVISDLLPGVSSDRNRSRRYSEIIDKPDEFLRLITMPLQNNKDR